MRLVFPWVSRLVLVVLACVVFVPCAQAAPPIVVTNVAELQQAVAGAQDGDVISLAAGTYELDTELVVSKQLTFRGAGARSTILDGQQKTRIFNIVGGSGVTISG